MNEQSIDNRVIYNELWDGACNDMRKFGPTFLHERRLILKMLEGLDFSSVLDIGCGTGEILERLMDIQGQELEIAGIDISEKSIEICKKRFNSENFYLMDCSKEHLKQSFDLVTCIDVIEHVPDDESFMRNLSKMVKNNLLLVTLEGRMRKNEPYFGHMRNYKIGQLEEMGARYGLEAEKVIRWGFPFFSPLYRDLLENNSLQQQAFGNYGFFKKMITKMIYTVFNFNSHNYGDLVCILYKKKI